MKEDVVALLHSKVSTLPSTPSTEYLDNVPKISFSQVFMSSAGAGPPPVPLISFKRAASFFFVALEISCHFFLQSTTSRVISEMLTEFTRSVICCQHCVFWLLVRPGENFPLIVLMLAETP